MTDDRRGRLGVLLPGVLFMVEQLFLAGFYT